MMELAPRMTKPTAILHRPVRFDKILSSQKCIVRHFESSKNVSSRIVDRSKVYHLVKNFIVDSLKIIHTYEDQAYPGHLRYFGRLLT